MFIEIGKERGTRSAVAWIAEMLPEEKIVGTI